MIYSARYKQVIASLLMAMYIFIAMPVWLWHKHEFSVRQKTTNREDKISFVTNISKNFTEGACEVCSYKFSTYEYDSYVYSTTPLAITRDNNRVLIPDIISSSSSLLPNKDPPTITCMFL